MTDLRRGRAAAGVPRSPAGSRPTRSARPCPPTAATVRSSSSRSARDELDGRGRPDDRGDRRRRLDVPPEQTAAGEPGVTRPDPRGRARPSVPRRATVHRPAAGTAHAGAHARRRWPRVDGRDVLAVTRRDVGARLGRGPGRPALAGRRPSGAPAAPPTPTRRGCRWSRRSRAAGRPAPPRSSSADAAPAPGSPAAPPRPVGADAVLCLSFPLHPPGSAGDVPRRRAARCRVAPACPLHVVQGRRDPFGTPEEVRAELPDPGLVTAAKGTHSFGREPADVVAAARPSSRAWSRATGRG